MVFWLYCVFSIVTQFLSAQALQNAESQQKISLPGRLSPIRTSAAMQTILPCRVIGRYCRGRILGSPRCYQRHQPDCRARPSLGSFARLTCAFHSLSSDLANRHSVRPLKRTSQLVLKASEPARPSHAASVVLINPVCVAKDYACLLSTRIYKSFTLPSYGLLCYSDILYHYSLLFDRNTTRL